MTVSKRDFVNHSQDMNMLFRKEMLNFIHTFCRKKTISSLEIV